MSLTYIISQVFVVIFYVLLALTFVSKTRKRLFIYNYISNFAQIVAYALLNAWTGVAMMSVAVIRNVFFGVHDKFDRTPNRLTFSDSYVLTFIIVASAVLTYFTYENVFSVIAVLGTIVYTISIWQQNYLAYKIMGFVSSVLYVVYNIGVSSIMGAILESVISVVIIFSLIWHKDNKNIKEIDSNAEQ